MAQKAASDVRHTHTRHGRITMAKVAGPLYSANAVGRFANAIVYNVWRGIQYAKKLTSPAQPRTPRQLLIRGYLAQLSQAWQGLTGAQRTAWQVWADANQPADPQFNRNTPWSGMNAFVGLNVLKLDIGEAVNDDPPVDVAPDPLSTFAAAYADTTLTVSWDAPPAAVLGDVWLWINPSPARNPNIQLFTHSQYSEAAGTQVTYTAPSPGTYYFLGRAILTTDGQHSTYERTQVTVP
jgi:hypothetical protein